MSVATDLATLGWRTTTATRLRQAIADFQIGWNLGLALAVDGNAGPVTLAAIKTSTDRHRAGLKDFSENFNANEFACACGGRDASCRRIWAHRELVRACERYREMSGPLTIVRGCRCPTQNRAVGGADNSQHLYGTGVDVEVFRISPATLAAKRFVSGIGRYKWGSGTYVRHFDVRHVWGSDPRNTTDQGSPAKGHAPAQWSYGTAKTAPLTPRPGAPSTPPKPPKATPPKQTPPKPTTPTEETDMPLSIADAKTIIGADIIPSPDLSKTNPTWALGSYARETFRLTLQVRDLVAAQSPEKIAAAVKAALGTTGPAVDVDELARKIVVEITKEQA